MRATHIVFQHAGALGIANVLAGTYWIAPSPQAFSDRCYVLRQAGAKVAEWKSVRLDTNTRSNVIDDLDALGVRIK